MLLTPNGDIVARRESRLLLQSAFDLWNSHTLVEPLQSMVSSDLITLMAWQEVVPQEVIRRRTWWTLRSAISFQ